jgi:hypothetical protein
MASVLVLYAAADVAAAQAVMAELHGKYAVRDIAATPAAQTRGDVLLLVLSPEQVHDATVRAGMIAALDNGQHIVVATTAPVKLPKLIDHLRPVALYQEDATEQLHAAMHVATSGEAGRPVRVATPRVQRSNRNAGLVGLVIALAMFAVGIYAVGVLDIEAPGDEYAQIETEVVLTRDALSAPELARYAQLLPQSTEAAAAYTATWRAVPTAYRAFVAGTATAVAQGTPLRIYAMPTPDPAGGTPEPTADNQAQG